MQITEIAYFTEQVEEMAAFYQRLLEVEPVARSEDMAIFLSGETRIFIHRSYQPQGDELPPENHTAFRVADVDAAAASLAAKGLVLEVAPRDFYWGRSAYLRDPDGHLIELIQEE
jgi:catechol 2,3-dioxygenase-like lactoylglutathione lyase family enzyme